MARTPTPEGAVKIRRLRISASLNKVAAEAIREALFPETTGIAVLPAGALTVEVNVPVEGELDVATRAAAAERLVATRIGDLRSVSATQSRALPEDVLASIPDTEETPA